MWWLAVLSMVLGSTWLAPDGVNAVADPPRTIDIVATDDMKFNLARIAAKPGEQLRIRLVVKGKVPKIAMAHNVVVLKIGTNVAKLLKDGGTSRQTDFIPSSMMSSVIAKTPFAGAGEAVQVTFTVPSKPGRYPFICTFPGHYQAGMKGVLTVR
jgi:azurin